MKKKFNTIEEQSDRIKSLFTEERLYGNLVTEQTEEGLLKSIKKIQKENDEIEGYVLDLRSNPGGLLSQAVKTTDIFLKRGEIVSTRGREKKDIKRYRAKNKDYTSGKPIVVLINGGSVILGSGLLL